MPGGISRRAGLSSIVEFKNPPTVVRGTGQHAVHAEHCGRRKRRRSASRTDTSSLRRRPPDRRDGGRRCRGSHPSMMRRYAAMPAGSVQNSILHHCAHDLVGARCACVRFWANSGPARRFHSPDSHNAGRLRTVRSAARIRWPSTEDRAPAPHRRAHGYRRGPGRRDLRLPVKVPVAGSTSATCMPAGTARSPDTPATSPGGSLEVDTIERPRHRRSHSVPGSRRPSLRLASVLGRRATTRGRPAKAYGLEGCRRIAPNSVIGSGPDLNAASSLPLARRFRALGLRVKRCSQPGDHHGSDRDRSPSGRGPGHVPSLVERLRGLRTARPLRGNSIPGA